jgi:hypothetical protein
MKRYSASLAGTAVLVLLTTYWLLRPVTEPDQAMPEKNLSLLAGLFVYYLATLVALLVFVWRLVKQGRHKWLSFGSAIVACIVSLLLNEMLARFGLSSPGGIMPFKLAAPNLVILFLNILVDTVPPRGWK